MGSNLWKLRRPTKEHVNFCPLTHEARLVRIFAGIGLFLCLVNLNAPAKAAPPKRKPSQSLPKVDADVLPPGRFVGTIVSAPNSDRMFTLKITYPEVRLKRGAKMPKLSHPHARSMHNQYRQMMNLRQRRGRGGHHHLYNMMQMQRMFMQMQMNRQQVMARLQQQQLRQEMRVLQQEIKAVQNMYQVVPVSRNVDFQADANVKVRTKDLPGQFDEKGNIKRYTPAELSALKGKDKGLIGYESSIEALQPGLTVLVSLHTHKKSNSSAFAAPPSNQDQADDKEADASIEHKMQVTMIVILKDGDALQNSVLPGKRKKK